MATIQIKRGLLAGLPIGASGEPLWTTDTFNLYIGDGVTNHLISTGGTVTSISGSGGTTGLTLTGGAITTSGTLTLGGTLITSNGGTGVASYTQGDIIFYNSGTAFTKLAKDIGTTRYLSNTGTSNNPAWAQINLPSGVTGILPVANGGTGVWVDYSATSTVTGWSSFVTKIIRYRLENKTMFFTAYIEGTSNTTTASFTLPNALGASAPLWYKIDLGTNSGTNASKLYTITAASSTVSGSNSATSSGVAWTASGTKIMICSNTYIEID